MGNRNGEKGMGDGNGNREWRMEPGMGTGNKNGNRE